MEDKHLIDDGAVIGYQPNLQYKKNIDIEQEIKKENPKKDSSLELHTNALIYLLNNLPFKVLTNVSNSKNKLDNLIQEIAKQYPIKNYEKFSDINALLTAIETDNQEYIDDFVNYHSHDINGSIIPEIINSIYESSKRLKLLSDTIGELYYGSKNISTEEAKEKDKVLVSSLANLENEKHNHKINYVSINYDSLLNRVINLYSTGIVQDCMNLSSVLNNKNDFNIDDNTSQEFINKIYNQVNNLLDLRIKNFNSYQNIEILPKSLYNYYSIRQDLINFYNLTGQTSSIFLGNKIIEYQDKLDEAIEDVAKVFLGNRKHIQLINNLEEEKQAILDAYNSAIANLNN